MKYQIDIPARRLKHPDKKQRKMIPIISTDVRMLKAPHAEKTTGRKSVGRTKSTELSSIH
jgi:hypothetical protein